MLKLSILATSACAAIAVAAPAAAQDTPQPANSAESSQDIVFADQRKVPDIIVSSGAPQYAEDIGQAVTVIDRRTIEQRQTVALSDLLATTPGVTVSRNGGLGTLTTVRIRGAEGEQTLTLIDGVRVNDPSSPGGGFDFANLLTGSIDRVEVLRGPNSVPWGSQAIGGVVNVTTMQPGYGLQARGNVEYGSFDTVFANGGVSGKSGIVSASLNAGYLKTDGISAASAGTEPDGYRQYGATGRVEVALADNVKLDLRGYYARSRVDIDGLDFNTFLPADDGEYAKTQEVYGYAGLNADFLGGRFKNRVAFTISDINRDNYDPAFGPAVSFFSRGRSERYQYQGDFQAVDGVRLVAGAEHEQTRYNDGQYAASRGVTSFYGEAILSPVDHMTLTGGLRYDDDSVYGGHTTWGANAVYTLPTQTTIRASYAEGFKAPTLYQLYGRFGNSVFGNLKLKPETAQSYDVGVEQRLVDGRIVASLTWFHRDTRNQIDFGTTGYINIDKARAQGVEFALDLRPTEALTLTGSYSFIDAINLSPGLIGNDLARRPRQSVSASIDWKTPIGLGLGATVLSVGDSFDDAGNFTRLEGYTIVGLRADFPVGDKFSIYGRVDNLFDEKYEVARGYGTPGRAAYGGIRLKFN